MNSNNKKLSLKYKRGTKAVDPPDDYVIEDFQGTGKRMSYGELRRLDPSKLDEDQRLFMIFADEKFNKEINYQRSLANKAKELPTTGIEGVLTFPQRMYMQYVQGYDADVAKRQTPQESRLAEQRRKEFAYADELGEANQSLMGPLQYKKDLEDNIALYGPNDPRSIASKRNLEQVNKEIEEKKRTLQEVKANPAAATARNLNKQAIKNVESTVKANPIFLSTTPAEASSTDTNRNLRVLPSTPYVSMYGPSGKLEEDPSLPYDPEGFKFGTQGVYAEGIQQVYVPQVPTVDTFGNVTSLAATGGQLGGPIGAGVGAVLGAGLSLFQAEKTKKLNGRQNKLKELMKPLNLHLSLKHKMLCLFLLHKMVCKL